MVVIERRADPKLMASRLRDFADRLESKDKEPSHAN
jgi:hypothetical protein